MNIKEYLEHNTEFFDNSTKIVYFEIGYIINRLLKEMTQKDVNEFVNKELKNLNEKYLTKDKITNKLIPKLTYYNEKYKLSQDSILEHIGEVVIDTNGLEDLMEDPVLYISLGISLSNKIK